MRYDDLSADLIDAIKARAAGMLSHVFEHPRLGADDYTFEQWKQQTRKLPVDLALLASIDVVPYMDVAELIAQYGHLANYEYAPCGKRKDFPQWLDTTAHHTAHHLARKEAEAQLDRIAAYALTLGLNHTYAMRSNDYRLREPVGSEQVSGMVRLVHYQRVTVHVYTTLDVTVFFRQPTNREN